MTYVFAPPLSVSAAVAGEANRFPVRRIFCVGRNYADHVREMGNDPKTEPPIFFTKPADALMPDGAEVPYPPQTANLHHEVELVLALGKGGAAIAEADAPSHLFGCAVGVDLTKRDTQAAAKQAGAPWDAAKGFDHSAPMGPIARGAAPGGGARIWLSVNGDMRQDARLAEMIWKPAEIISALSRVWTLRPGDLIFTGSPAGVGALQRGDGVRCGVEGVGELGFSIV